MKETHVLFDAIDHVTYETVEVEKKELGPKEVRILKVV